MQNAHGTGDDGYLARFLRDSVADCVKMIASDEQAERDREEQVNFEQLVRFWLTCQLIPDILAVACGIFDFDGNVINQEMPDLIKNALPTVPLNAEFIAEVMRQVLDQEKMNRLAANLHSGDDLISLALGQLNDSLHRTMEIDQPDD